MIQAWIILKKGLVKKNVSEKKDSFDYAEKTYFIKQDRIFLKQAMLFNKKVLLYFEGIPLPISVSDISFTVATGKMCIAIDGASLHDLASIKILNVLTKHSFTKFEKVICVLIVILMIMVGVGIYGTFAV